MKYNKESYITARNSPGLWENHANVNILREYSSYIKGSVLDIGCNHGATTYWLKDFNVKKITRLDINAEALEYAKGIFTNVDIESEFIQVDLTREGVSSTYNTITSFHTLEHIYPEDVDTFLTNIYKMLKKGGFFIIAIPYEMAYNDPCHVAYYNETTLSSVMEKNSFKVVECFKDDRWNERNILTGLFKK